MTDCCKEAYPVRKDHIMLQSINQIPVTQEQAELEQQLQRANQEMAQQVRYSPLWMDARAKYNNAANRLHRMRIPMAAIHRLVGIYGSDYTIHEADNS